MCAATPTFQEWSLTGDENIPELCPTDFLHSLMQTQVEGKQAPAPFVQGSAWHWTHSSDKQKYICSNKRHAIYNSKKHITHETKRLPEATLIPKLPYDFKVKPVRSVLAT
jgi:hypothetical protein